MSDFILQKVYQHTTPQANSEEDKQQIQILWKSRVLFGFHLLLGNIFIIKNLLNFDLTSDSWVSFVVDELIFNYKILALIAYSYVIFQCYKWSQFILEIGISKLNSFLYKQMIRLFRAAMVKPEKGIHSVSQAFTENMIDSKLLVKTEAGKLQWNEGTDFIKFLRMLERRFGRGEGYYDFLKWVLFTWMILFMALNPNFFSILVKSLFVMFFTFYTGSLFFKYFFLHLLDKFASKLRVILAG